MKNKSLEVPSNIGANILFPKVQVQKNYEAALEIFSYGYRLFKKGNTYIMQYLNVSEKSSTEKILGKKYIKGYK